MKHFVIYNAAGEILRTGTCPEEAFSFQAQAGEFAVEAQADVEKDAVDPQAQQVIPGGRVIPPKPAPTYDQARRSMYPKVEEQLDMLWHAMDGFHTPRIEPFYSVIKAVKDANPKPEVGTVFNVGEI